MPSQRTYSTSTGVWQMRLSNMAPRRAREAGCGMEMSSTAWCASHGHVNGGSCPGWCCQDEPDSTVGSAVLGGSESDAWPLCHVQLLVKKGVDINICLENALGLSG